MHSKTTILALLALVSSSFLVTPSAQAQQNDQPSGAWHGQDSEFGSIRAPYSVDMNGDRVPVEAKIVLRKSYEDKDSRFFMFAWTVQGTPLDVKFDHLTRSDNGQEMTCYRMEGSSTDQLKCFVDLRELPPVGTEIYMTGTVGSSRTGQFQVGAIVMAFTYTWTTVSTSNGLDAQLYGYSFVNVQKATSGSRALGGLGNAIPGVGVLGMIGAAALVAVVVGRRRVSK